MLIDMKNLISITEANRNFSKVARAVDEIKMRALDLDSKLAELS